MLKVIGAGLGRTGTTSLKIALERLLGEPCYHMTEVFNNLDHIPLWRQATLAGEPDWHVMFKNYSATVDWPAASFWPELCRAFPEAMVILSIRDPDEWWESVSNTIFIDHNPVPETDWQDMWFDLVAHRFTRQLDNRKACIDKFQQHYDNVRQTVPSGRLLEWSVREGWQPICERLELPVPPEPFPHSNTKQNFQELLKLIADNH